MDRNLLTNPFPNIRQREGAGGKRFDYVAGSDVLGRVLEATAGAFDWQIVDFRLVTQEKANRNTGAVYSVAIWVMQGRLTLPGLGSRDGIGTAVMETEDSAKSAETDAFKRAAVKFGVALHLYQEDDQNSRKPESPPRRPQARQERAQPPASAPDGPLLPAQADAIRNLCKRAGLDSDGFAHNAYGVAVDNLTQAQASALIHSLNKRPAAA